MKKFLIYYFIFVIFACISIFILRVRAREKIVSAKVEPRKKIIVISTVTIEPLARVVRESGNEIVFFEWMAVEDATLVMEEQIKKFNNQGRRLNIHLEYNNSYNIY